MNESIEKFSYRRQFLFTPQKIENFPYSNWARISIGKSHWLYSHPDLSVTQVAGNDTELTLIGYMIDAKKNFSNDRQILDWILSKINSNVDVFDSTESIGGRWILVVRQPDAFFLLNDSCGMRQVFYHSDKEKNIWCCTQPALLSKFTELTEHKGASKLQEIPHRKYWLPGSLSEFVNVTKLLPNHYLNLVDGNISRFWPIKPVESLSMQRGANEVSLLLKQVISNINHRFDLSLPLTAGYDSRTILSACRNCIDDIYVYTMLQPPTPLKNQELAPPVELNSIDIVYPKRLMKKAGVAHHLIYGNKKMEPWFEDIYMENVTSADPDYWGPVVFGLLKEHPQHRVTLNGNCSEIARCYYHKYGDYDPKKITSNYLARLVWEETEIVVNILDEWLKEAKKIEAHFNINVLDLLYWEHRIGGWYGKTQSMCDIAMEIFSPFNNRLILSKMLAVDKQYRIEPNYLLYRAIIKNLWSDLLVLPFNRSKEHKILKGMLSKLGMFQICKDIYYKLTKKPIN